MPDGLQHLSVDEIELVDDPLLQLGIRHGFTVQEGQQIQACRWEDISAFAAGYETLMEKDGVAPCIEPFKPAFLANMRTAGPRPAGCFFTSEVPFGFEDLPVDLEQGVDEILLEPFICHVPARIHEFS